MKDDVTILSWETRVIAWEIGPLFGFYLWLDKCGFVLARHGKTLVVGLWPFRDLTIGKSLAFFCVLCALCGKGFCQQPQAPDLVGTSLKLLLQDPPQAVQPNSIFANRLDNQGSCSYYYWVVANNTIGNAQPSGPAAVQNSACTLVHGVQIGWSSVTGANSYDVLRTSTPSPPAGTCNCAVATTVTGTTATDTGTLSGYTVSTFDPSLVSCLIRNMQQGPGSTTVNFAAGCNVSGIAPSGTAGGDLSGTYPNPTVAKVEHVSYAGCINPSTNSVPVVTGSNAVTCEAVPNAALQNSSLTVNGTNCTLGAPCNPPGTTPGGALMDVQFFDTGGVFGGDPNFTFNKLNDHVGIGTLDVTDIQFRNGSSIGPFGSNLSLVAGSDLDFTANSGLIFFGDISLPNATLEINTNTKVSEFTGPIQSDPATANTCARFDAAKRLVSAAGDCINGSSVATQIGGPARTVTMNTLATCADFLIRSDATGGAFTITLPATCATNVMINIKRIDINGGVNITISGNGNNIDGQPNLVISTVGANFGAGPNEQLFFDRTSNTWNILD